MISKAVQTRDQFSFLVFIAMIILIIKPNFSHFFR